MSFFLRTSLRHSLPRTYRAFTSTSEAMGKQEWLFILPDKKDSLEARMKVRPQHLQELQKHIDSGACAVGGASLDEPIKEGVAAKINGSMLILEADTEAEAREIVEGDVYYREGIWDIEKIQMFPFRSAVRQAKI